MGSGSPVERNEGSNVSNPAIGPIYGVPLIKTLPIPGSMMQQAMPSRQELEDIQQMSVRVAAAYEVLLSHYLKLVSRIEELGLEL